MSTIKSGSSRTKHCLKSINDQNSLRFNLYRWIEIEKLNYEQLYNAIYNTYYIHPTFKELLSYITAINKNTIALNNDIIYGSNGSGRSKTYKRGEFIKPEHTKLIGTYINGCYYGELPSTYKEDYFCTIPTEYDQEYNSVIQRYLPVIDIHMIIILRKRGWSFEEIANHKYLYLCMGVDSDNQPIYGKLTAEHVAEFIIKNNISIDFDPKNLIKDDDGDLVYANSDIDYKSYDPDFKRFIRQPDGYYHINDSALFSLFKVKQYHDILNNASSIAFTPNEADNDTFGPKATKDITNMIYQGVVDSETNQTRPANVDDIGFMLQEKHGMKYNPNRKSRYRLREKLKKAGIKLITNMNSINTDIIMLILLMKSRNYTIEEISNEIERTFNKKYSKQSIYNLINKYKDDPRYN